MIQVHIFNGSDQNGIVIDGLVRASRTGRRKASGGSDISLAVEVAKIPGMYCTPDETWRAKLNLLTADPIHGQRSDERSCTDARRPPKSSQSESERARITPLFAMRQHLPLAPNALASSIAHAYSGLASPLLSRYTHNLRTVGERHRSIVT